MSGEPFSSTLYSVEPIFTVPEGSARFCCVIALITSSDVMPFACKDGISTFTETWRAFPPHGYGTAAPGTVAIWFRITLIA